MRPISDQLPIAMRGFAVPVKTEDDDQDTVGHERRTLRGPSELSLTFDTETFTDAPQQLRFGVYQVRRSGILHDQGFFYDPFSLSDADRSTLYAYAAEHDLNVLTLAEFIEHVFFPYVYDLYGLCIGFNLPFDLSRIAIEHNSARGTMRGGFTFKLSDDRARPRARVKHLTSREALIQFAKPPGQTTPRGMRNRGMQVPPHRGFFVDVATLAGALLSGGWSLETLTEHLKTEHRKQQSDEHGGPLTPEYLGYAVNDVQATWECFEQLDRQYAGYGLTQTNVNQIYSEASIGKASLKEMGIRPWPELQPDAPPELIGIIMSTYGGGRSEVHLRRVISRVLYCDFLSMYPTVCTLMGLWTFVIAEQMDWQDATEETRAFLNAITLDDLQRPETWRALTVLVQVQPDDDLFPVRAPYDNDAQRTIGLNYLTNHQPHWFTMADCIASKLLTGTAPNVLRAIRFRPVGVQPNLQSLNIAGKPEYRVNPAEDDFYRRLIDLRSAVKTERDMAKTAGDNDRAAALDTEQHALKILANATSYGIFVELNVTEHDKLQEVICYGPDGTGFSAWTRNVEEPGRYFHPLLATLITGAARLMLAMTEKLAADAGVSWAFCDTDSMALAMPDGMAETDFLTRAQQVREWFSPLNPYETPGSILKIEDANYRLNRGTHTDDLEPLNAFPVSAKRYALFNIDSRGRPVLRKASAHGLGHLRAPYDKKDAPRTIPKPVVELRDLEVDRWQYDLWYRIVQAALAGHPDQVRLDDLPGFDLPAVSRYAATTPGMLRWFKRFNRGKPYREQVRPFGFLLAFQARPASRAVPEIAGSDDAGLGSGDQQRVTGKRARRSKMKQPRPVAPFERDPRRAAEGCFDRDNSEPVASDQLMTYREALAQYHLHPEAKFQHADYLDAGATERRHVLAAGIEVIGKEANRWEEQFYLGLEEGAQIEYGFTPDSLNRLHGSVLRAGKQFGQRELAKVADVSLSEVSAILQGQRRPRRDTLMRLWQAAVKLQQDERDREIQAGLIIEVARERCREIGLRAFARELGGDPANVSKTLASRRKPSKAMLAKLAVATEQPLA